jgi:hypothetical protein
MPTIIKSEADGTIYEAKDLEAITLDEIDARIAHANNHVTELERLREEFVALSAAPELPAAPAAPVAPEPLVPPVEAPAAPVVDPSVPPVGDAGQAPAIPAVDSPNTDTAAVNNGQADPAASTNPNPNDVTATPAPTISTDPNAPGATVPDQPVINA